MAARPTRTSTDMVDLGEGAVERIDRENGDIIQYRYECPYSRASIYVV